VVVVIVVLLVGVALLLLAPVLLLLVVVIMIHVAYVLWVDSVKLLNLRLRNQFVTDNHQIITHNNKFTESTHNTYAT
jgi:hypothetical protein